MDRRLFATNTTATIIIATLFVAGTVDANAEGSTAKDEYAQCEERDSGAFRKKYMASMFAWENDSVLFEKDNQYTNGMKYTVIKDPVCGGGLLGSSQPGRLVGWTLGMNMYTPTEITDPNPPTDDRPWSGWLYVGGVW